jgi:hypothetical protein
MGGPGYVTGGVCDPDPMAESKDVWSHGNPQRIAREVSPGDRKLVEWVANAAVGDPFPEPWSYSSSPLESIVLTLSDVGVMARPARGSEWAAIAQEATSSAKRWLEENPPPPPRPYTPPPSFRGGPPAR